MDLADAVDQLCVDAVVVFIIVCCFKSLLTGRSASELRIIIIIEDLLVLRSLLVHLQVLYHLRVLLPALHLLQIVLVKFVL